jgi:Tfp pilus assembly protein PilO
VFGLDRLIAWSLRYRLHGTVLFSLVAVNLLIFLILVAPAYRYTVTSEASLQAARSKLSQLLQYQKAQEAVVDLEKTFLTQQELALLTERLPSMARRNQLMLPGVNYQSEKQREGDLRRIALNFTVTGRYGDIRRFIDELEGLELFLYINNLVIAGTSRTPGLPDLQVGLVAVLK